MKEKIKSEIQRLIKAYSPIQSAEGKYKVEAYNEVLSFINSLEDTEKDFGIKNVEPVWHDANNVPTKKELCLIMHDSNNGLTLNNVEVVIANPLARRFVTCSYPHKTGKQYTVQGETPIQVDVYHSCRDYIPFSDVDKWAYISDLFNLNNSQEEPVSENTQFAQMADKYEQQVLIGEYQMQESVANHCRLSYYLGLKDGAQWQKANLWKDAQGDDLPEIDREVIVLVKSLPEYEDSLLKVAFAHRPPEYWEGKSIGTGEITRYEPMRYDKGQWSKPAVVWWLDVELPKEEE